MVNQNLFSLHSYFKNHFRSNPVLDGFFTEAGTVGHVPLTTAHKTIRMCRHFIAVQTILMMREQVVS